MSSEDIRKNISLLEHAQNEQVPAIVNEVAPMGLLKTLATGAAAMFSDIALGKLDTGKAANKTYANYLRYLGSVSKSATEGTVGDLYSFLAKIGSNQKAMMAGLTKGTGLPIRSEADVKKYWDTVIKTKDKIANSIMSYTQNAAQLPPKDLEPQDFAKQAQQGAASVARIEKSKPSVPAKAAATPTPAASAPPPPPPMDAVETAIKTSIGSQDVKKQTSSIEAALKALGA